MTFSTEERSRPSAVAIADLNKDGHLDIAVANSYSCKVGILLGYGNVNFSNCYIAVANRDTSNVVILLGYGNGNLASQVIYSAGSYGVPCSIVVVDFNGDGQLDIITANYNNNGIGIFTGHGNGTFNTIQIRATGSASTPTYVAVSDFNNDKRLDIAVVNYGIDNVVVVFGFEHEDFYNRKSYSTGIGSGPISLSIGDFNNDNRLDFIIANYWTNDMGVFLGSDNEPFASIAEKHNIGFVSKPYTAVIGDFNNDGRSDIVIANYGINNGGVNILIYIYPFNNIELQTTIELN